MLLVLVVEDDSNDSKVVDVQQRLVELSEKERVHASAIELLWPFTRPEGRHRFPSFSRRYFPNQLPLAPGVPKKVIRCVSIALVFCPLFHLYAPRPHSLTILAYESTTHTSIIGRTNAIYGEVDRVPTCVYRIP